MSGLRPAPPAALLPPSAVSRNVPAMSAYKLRQLVVVISLHVSVCLVRPGTHIKYINVSVTREESRQLEDTAAPLWASASGWLPTYSFDLVPLTLSSWLDFSLGATLSQPGLNDATVFLFCLFLPIRFCIHLPPGQDTGPGQRHPLTWGPFHTWSGERWNIVYLPN